MKIKKMKVEKRVENIVSRHRFSLETPYVQKD